MRLRLLISLLLLSAPLFTQNLTSSLVACYPMNGNCNEPINFLTGTLSAVSPTVDRFNNSGSAIAFSGNSSSYVQLPNNPLIKPTNYISAAGWFKSNASATGQLIFAFNGCSSYFEGYNFALVQQSGGGMKLLGVKADGTCSGSGQALLFGATTLTNQVWYHLGFTIGNDSMKIFVNGVQDGAMAINMAFSYASTGVVLGGSNYSGYNNPFAGSMDNVRFYNRKLTNQEFYLLYQNDPSCVVPMIPTTAGFTAPDTICINQSAQPLNTSAGTLITNYWSICNSTTAVTPVVSSVNVTSSSGPVYMTTNKDGTDYYSFVTGNVGNNLMRLYYGNSLSNTPTLTNLGTFSSALTQAEGIHIQQEGSSWYGVVVGSTGGYVAKLNFGNTLANTPTVTNLGNIGSLSYPHNIHVFRSGSNYYALVLNQSAGVISRLNFGNSISNTPTATALGMNTAVSTTVFGSASQMAVVSYNGSWHVFVCNDGSSSFLTRLDFGNSLLNVPTASVIGNPGSMLNGPRGIVLWPDCGGIKGFIANRNTNQLLNVNIQGGPTGAVSLGSSGISAPLSFPQTITRVRVGDTSFVFVVNVSNNSITKLKFPTCTSLPSSTLQNPSASTYTSAGNYTISLHTNENLPDGSAYCKQLTVIPSFVVTSTVSPAIACTGQTRTLAASGAGSYTWYPGNLNGSVVTVTPALGNMVYTVVGAIGSCTAQQVFTVTTLSGSSVSVSVTPPAVCQGNSSTLTASGALSYSWQPGNSLGPILIVTPFASTQYTLSGTNAVGCVTSTIVTLTVTPYPSLVANPGTATVCSGAAITLTATGAASYTWMPGNVLTNTMQVSPSSNTVYSLTGSTNGCASSTTVQVTVVASPTVTASASSNTVCSGSTITLSATGAGNYTWTPGNINGGTITVSPTANTVYTVRGSNGACTASAIVNITVAPLPALLPSSASPTICAGQSVVLSASNAVTYTWMPGNIQLQTPTVSPASTTIYTVSGTSAAGCVGTATLTQAVNPLPTITVGPPSATVCAPGSLTLFALGATTFTWLPMNVTGSAVFVSVNASTIYTVNGTLNGCQGSTTVPIMAIPRPTVSASASSPSVCFGNSVSLSATGAASFQWLPGGQTTQSITVYPASNTIYSVVGTNTNGCTGTASVSITVAPSPTVGIFLLPSTVVCVGSVYTLMATGATSYTWNNGSNSSVFTLSPQSNTTTVYTVTGAIGACSVTATRSVTAIQTPTISATATPSAVCAGGTVNLTATGGTQYVWFPMAVMGNSITVTPASSTTYAVVGYLNGCASNASVPVTVNPSPTVAVSSSNNPACVGSTIQLTAGGAASYTWLPGGQTTSVISVSPSSNTTYTLQGVNAQNCRGSAVYTQIMAPVPVIVLSTSSPSICSGSQAIINATGGGPSSTYTLLPGGTNGLAFLVSPLATTIYTVLGRIGTCVSSGTIQINVAPGVSLTASANPSVICRGQQVTLTASGATSYTWQPGPYFQSQVVVSPNISSLYGVRGANSSGCSATAAVVVIVQPTPTVNVSVFGTGTQTSICAGTTVTLVATGAPNVTWQPGGQTTHVIIVSPTITTTYTVKGVGGNCLDEETITVNVYPYPALSIYMTADNVCAGGTVGLVAGGATNYTWLPGGSNSPNVVIKPPGNTTYTLIGSVGPGCTGVTSALVRVNPKPVISAAAPSVACAGSNQTVVLSGANGYLWNGTPLSSSVLVVPMQGPVASTVVGFDGNGCSDTVLVNIPVLPSPSAGIIPSGTLICSGASVTLTAEGSGQFSWFPDAVFGPTLVSQPGVTTTYTLINSNGQCAGSAVITISVTECGQPWFGLANAASTPVLYNSNYYLVNFSVTVENRSTVDLSGVELSTDLESTFHAPISYTLQEVPRLLSGQSGLNMNSAFDGASQKQLTLPASSTLQAGKTDMLLIKLLVDPKGFSGVVKNSVLGTALTPWGLGITDSSASGFDCDPDHDGTPLNNNIATTIELNAIDLFIPDAFSPDGDGRYDLFVIKGLAEREGVFTVFNRWGNEVYRTSGTKIEWDGFPNKGMVSGSGKVPPGTYFYVLEFSGKSKGESLKGFIVVEY